MHKSGFLQSMTFNRFILLLCGIYIGMVLFIHNRLQPDIANDNILPEIKSELQEKNDIHLVNLQKWVRTQKDLRQLNKDVDEFQIQVKEVKAKIEKTKSAKTVNYFNDWCLKRSDENLKNNTFTMISQGIYIYSVFLDDRKKDVYIRMMTIIEKSRKKTPIFCHFDKFSILATQYEMCENHNKQYGGYVYSCLLPSNTSISCPLHVSTSSSQSTSDISFPVIPVKPVSNHNQFGICISPLFGTVPGQKLIEFIELSQILGAQKFFFYDNLISSDMRKILTYYQDKNIVKIIPWKLPDAISENNIWYHGQLIAHNDCLYRSMSTLEHVLFNDIDEFVIPHTSAKYWKDVFPKEFQDKYCGIAFSSAFFEPSLGNNHPSGLSTMGMTGRTKLFSHIRTKIMAKPLRVFEIGIHHISKQNEEKWTVLKYKPDLAYLHHYRKCVGNYGMKCNQFETDKTILKYYDEVVDKFAFASKMLNFPVQHVSQSNVTRTV